MGTKYYAHFLVEEPDPRGLQEYRGIVDSTRNRGSAANSRKRP